MIEEYDVLVNYCHQLGGQVPFRYCRIVNGDLPCRGIMVCWEFRVEISEFLGKHYSTGQIQRALAPPTQAKLDIILMLIEKGIRKKGSDRTLISDCVSFSSRSEGDPEALEDRAIE